MIQSEGSLLLKVLNGFVRSLFKEFSNLKSRKKIYYLLFTTFHDVFACTLTFVRQKHYLKAWPKSLFRRLIGLYFTSNCHVFV